MKRLPIFLLLLGFAAAGLFFILTAPQRIAFAALDNLDGDALKGERVFHLGGCASCHAAPGAEEETRLVLEGGRRFETAFGTFIAPNISTSAAGLGSWTDADFATAMLLGVSPEGTHYYPAFPYTSYARMRPEDIMDLWAFMKTLPGSDMKPPPHETSFPFNIRRTLGVWKLLNLSAEPVFEPVGEAAARGRYLVEGPGHCAECHTPRDLLGGLDLDRWMGGGPNPDGKGRIPNLTPAALKWSEVDIAEYLRSGFTPEYDVVGGSMAEVVRNTARLTDTDRADIAAYLKSLPPVEAK